MRRSKLFEVLVIRSWWVILFIFLSLFLFDRAKGKLSTTKEHLSQKVKELSQKIEKERRLQEDLQEEIQRFEDPAFVELVLMRKLGLVSEGEKKVIFK